MHGLEFGIGTGEKHLRMWRSADDLVVELSYFSMNDAIGKWLLGSRLSCVMHRCYTYMPFCSDHTHFHTEPRSKFHPAFSSTGVITEIDRDLPDCLFHMSTHVNTCDICANPKDSLCLSSTFHVTFTDSLPHTVSPSALCSCVCCIEVGSCDVTNVWYSRQCHPSTSKTTAIKPQLKPSLIRLLTVLESG